MHNYMLKHPDHYPPAGFWRRIAAMLYDMLLVISMLIFATLLLLPYTHGHAIHAGNHAYQAYLLSLICIFYLGFWWKSGQTPGMRAWGICLISQLPTQLKFWQLGLRLLAGLLSFAAAGLGFLWMLFDSRHLTFYDRVSHTQVVRLR